MQQTQEELQKEEEQLLQGLSVLHRQMAVLKFQRYGYCRLQGKHKEALGFLEEAISLYPENEAYLKEANLYFEFIKNL